MTKSLNGIRVARISSVAFFLVSQLRAQIEYLHQAGVCVTAISGAGSELAALKIGPGLRHHIIEFGRMVDPWKDLSASFRLFFLFRKERFEIVHSTTPKAGLITAIAAFLARVPVRLHTFTGQPWVHLTGPIYRFARLSDRIIAFLSTRCYADSHSQRDFLVSEGLVPPLKIGVIGAGSLAGVDLERFNADRWSPQEKQSIRAQLGVRPDAGVFIFIGRIARDKGISELLQAFSRIISDGFDADLVLVGPLDEECGGAGYLSASDLAACARVHYTGYTDSPERYLAAADILCLPSYREGFGTVVIEAAAMRIPTIGTRINGLVDAVVDGSTGILVPPQDAAALHAVMRDLLDQPERIHRMGQAAYERCLSDFDARVINAAVADEYVRLLHVHAGKG